MRIANGMGHGLSKVSLEFDSKALISALTNPGRSDSYLIQVIQHFLKLDWEVEVLHSYRAGNTCADWLANYSCGLPSGLCWLEFPPPRLQSLLLADALKVTNTRVVNLSQSFVSLGFCPIVYQKGITLPP